jgi:hypothetical protein
VPQQGQHEVFHWPYRGGKTGAGKWKWFDENSSRQLEEAWRVGEETVIVQDEWGGQHEYNVRTMLGKNVPIGKENTITRQLHRVLDRGDV